MPIMALLISLSLKACNEWDKASFTQWEIDIEMLSKADTSAKIGAL